jgi:hypothetical protein
MISYICYKIHRLIPYSPSSSSVATCWSLLLCHHVVASWHCFFIVAASSSPKINGGNGEGKGGAFFGTLGFLWATKNYGRGWSSRNRSTEKYLFTQETNGGSFEENVNESENTELCLFRCYIDTDRHPNTSVPGEVVAL